MRGRGMAMRARRGQALVEFSLILPMLVLMLAAIVYLCGLVVSQQGLAVAARHAARAMALDATATGLKSAKGNGGVANPAAGTAAMKASLPQGQLRLTGVKWSGGARGGPYAGSYVKTEQLSIGGDDATMAIGCALYGATVTRDLRGDLQPVGQLASNMMPGRGLAGRLLPSLSSSSIMPAELPIRGTKSGAQGVLDTNTWIMKVVSRPPKVARVR